MMAAKHHVAEVYPVGVNEWQWRWRLKARNGKVLADSGQSYRTMVEAENAVALVFGGKIPTVMRVRNRLGKFIPRPGGLL